MPIEVRRQQPESTELGMMESRLLLGPATQSLSIRTAALTRYYGWNFSYFLNGTLLKRT